MSNEGVQNHLKNGGAHTNPHEIPVLLTNVKIQPENIGEGPFLDDSVVGGTLPDIQDGGTGSDIVPESSFEDFINFDTEHLENPDDIVDVGNFSNSIVGNSTEWLKTDEEVVSVNKIPFTNESSDSVELELGHDKNGANTLPRDLGDFFSSDSIAFSLAEGLSLPGSLTNLTKLSNGICHSSPVSPTNFLEETIPIGRSRSYSDTENDDKSQTKAFLEELERGSQLTAEDKEVMETSRKELQAYEFQVLAQDKSNSLLTPQELENLPVHGLEFEEPTEAPESPVEWLTFEETTDDVDSPVPKIEIIDSDMKMDCLSESENDLPVPSDLSRIVKTSLSFLSVPGQESNSNVHEFDECTHSLFMATTPMAISNDGECTESLLMSTGKISQPKSAKRHRKKIDSDISTSKTVAHASIIDPTNDSLQLDSTQVNITDIKPQLEYITQQTKTTQGNPVVQFSNPENTLTQNVIQPISLVEQSRDSNVTQLVYTDQHGQEQYLQLGSASNIVPAAQVQQAIPSIGEVAVPTVNAADVSNASSIAVATPSGSNMYLTAVPMLYFKDGCLMIPIQQVPAAEYSANTATSSESSAVAAAVAAEASDTAVKGGINSKSPPAVVISPVTKTAPFRKSQSVGRSASRTSRNVTGARSGVVSPSKYAASEEKKWTCSICSAGFPRLYKLKLHFMKHTGEKPFKCSQAGCKWAFTTAFKLKRHEESHLGKKDYVCDIQSCGKKFTTVYNLNTHKKTHTRLCTVECPTCSEKFSTQRQLDYHMRAQGHGQKELAYTCPHEGCGRKFFSRYCMGSHMRVHSQVEKIPCPVEGCERIFDKHCRMQQHLRSHTGEKPFLCTGYDCGAMFATASKLKRHARKHTGERRWVCDLADCGKAFLRAEHLRAHQITHTGQKPFVCNIPDCTARFKCKSSLYVHLKRHSQNATRDGQDGNSQSGKTQRNNKYSNKAALNQKNNYNKQLQNALGDLFTLINAEDLETLINSQVETIQQMSDPVPTGTGTIETILNAAPTQTINPADILTRSVSVNQDGLQTILNITPALLPSHVNTGQVINPVPTLLHQGVPLTTGLNLQNTRGNKSVINIAPAPRQHSQSVISAGSTRSELLNNHIKKRRITNSSTFSIAGFPSRVKIEASHADFPDSTTLSIADDESETSNSLVNPNDIMTSQAITFKDPETGAVYVQTQLLQDDPPNPDLCNNDIVCLEGEEQVGLSDLPYIFNDPGTYLPDNPGVLEFTGTTINLQDLE